MRTRGPVRRRRARWCSRRRTRLTLRRVLAPIAAADESHRRALALPRFQQRSARRRGSKMNRIATATVAALFLASSDALLVGVAPKCAPIRIFMESEMEYRKRMADTRDASKSIEWNAALAALDKITPPMVLGRPVTPIDIPALQSANLRRDGCWRRV